MFLLLLALNAAAAPIMAAADPADWMRLLERARARPTSTQTIKAGASEYEVSAVTLDAEAIENQCPAGMSARVSFHAARPLSGPGVEVYPARLTVSCVSAELTRVEAAVDAGFDGGVRDGSLYDPATEKVLALDKARLTPAQKARLEALVAGAVRRLLE